MLPPDGFSDEQWSQILSAPLLAGFAITAADPGGPISAVQESAAVTRSLETATARNDETSIIFLIAEAYKISEGRAAARDEVTSLVKGKYLAQAAQDAVERLGEIYELICKLRPEQAAEFREFLIVTAERTAEASTEGGFLGFGGVRVSEKEKKILAELKQVLSVP